MRDFGRFYSIVMSVFAMVFMAAAIAMMLAVFGSVIGKIFTFAIAIVCLLVAGISLYMLFSDELYKYTKLIWVREAINHHNYEG